MDITKLSDIEVKAFIYDHMATIADAQKGVKILNEELARRKQVAEVKPEETPKAE